MSNEEMRDRIKKHCTEANCKECRYYNSLSWCDSKTAYDLTDKEASEIHAVFFEDACREDVPIPVHDEVHSPKHYCRDGAMECIAEMVLLFGIEAVKHFCLCNIHKYRYRSNEKNGKQDVDKSDEYVRIYERLCKYGQTKEI